MPAPMTPPMPSRVSDSQPRLRLSVWSPSSFARAINSSIFLPMLCSRGRDFASAIQAGGFAFERVEAERAEEALALMRELMAEGGDARRWGEAA